MPFVDTTPANAVIKIKENNLQEKLAELLMSNGWTQSTKFTKYVYSANITPEIQPHNINVGEAKITGAEHYIFKTAQGSYLGLACIGEWKVYRDNSTVGWDVPVLPTATPASTFTTYCKTNFQKYKSNTALYLYMLEKAPSITSGQDIFLTAYETEQLRFALDAETYSFTYKKNGFNVIEPIIVTADPSVMQSPISKAVIRHPELDIKTQRYGFNAEDTNWWSDSEIRLQGFVDANTMFVILQADTAPAWEDNLVPSIPIYFGAVDPIDSGDKCNALFVGSTPIQGVNGASDVKNFKFDDPTVKQDPAVMPLLKSYPKHPSNGLDTVMVSRSKLGARYQEYFLSWNTASDLMPPDRKNDLDPKKMYPRSWNNNYNNESRYQFNPSRYSGKVHTSKIYIVHPEEGVRGSLSKAIALNSLNFNAGKLRIRKQNCPTKKFDIYRFFLVDGVSPLTKRPATPFRPVGIGIYDMETT